MDKTFLTVKELSAKLDVSEKTVYRMITSKSIPFAIKIGGQWRFNGEKIDKWISDAHKGEQGNARTNYKIKVADALTAGLIIYRAHGENRDEILDEILGMNNNLPAEVITTIKKHILFKESIISSSLRGLSLMVPIIDPSCPTGESKLLVAFLDKAMDFKAVDHVDTQTVFLLLAANKTEQLILKTRLQRLFMEQSFISMIRQQPNRRELIEKTTALESELLN